MRLKDGLILREVAGQYVIVPTGKRVQEIRSVLYMNASGAYLWEQMKNREFEVQELADMLLKRFPDAGRETAEKDVQAFVDMLKKRNLLEDSGQGGTAYIRVPVKRQSF